MNCSEFNGRMAAFITARMEPAERTAFEAHRDECPACAQELFEHTEISCRDLIGFLDAYEDDTLEPERRAVFDRHVGACPPCLSYLESYRATVAAGRSVCDEDDEELPTDLPEELFRAIVTARRKS